MGRIDDLEAPHNYQESSNAMQRDGIVNDTGHKATILNLPPVKGAPAPTTPTGSSQTRDAANGPYVFPGIGTFSQATRVETSLLEHQKNLEELIKHQQELIDAQKKRIEHLSSVVERGLEQQNKEKEEQESKALTIAPNKYRHSGNGPTPPPIMRRASPTNYPGGPLKTVPVLTAPRLQPGVAVNNRKNYRPPTAPQPGNGPFLPSSIQKRSVAVQAAAMQWTRYYFPKVMETPGGSQNAFFRHFDVSLFAEPPSDKMEYVETLFEKQKFPQVLKDQWYRLYYRTYKTKPDDVGFENTNPDIIQHRSKDMVASKGNVLESKNSTKRVEIEDFCRMIARMQIRSMDDMPPLCALQAGLLTYLAEQLETIGLAAEEEYRLREHNLIGELERQMSSLNKQLEESNLKNKEQMMSSLKSNAISKFKNVSKDLKTTKAMNEVQNLTTELDNTKQQVEDVRAQLEAVTAEKTSLEKKVEMLTKEGSALSAEGTATKDFSRAIVEGIFEVISSVTTEEFTEGVMKDVDLDNLTMDEMQTKAKVVVSYLKNMTEDLVGDLSEARTQLQNTQEQVALITSQETVNQSVVNEMQDELTACRKGFIKRLQEKEQMMAEKLMEQAAKFNEKIASMQEIINSTTKEKSAARLNNAFASLKSKTQEESMTEEARQKWEDERRRVIDLEEQLRTMTKTAEEAELARQDQIKKHVKQQADANAKLNATAQEIEQLVAQHMSEVEQLTEEGDMVASLQEELEAMKYNVMNAEQCLDSKMHELADLRQQKATATMKSTLTVIKEKLEKQQLEEMTEEVMEEREKERERVALLEDKLEQMEKQIAEDAEAAATAKKEAEEMHEKLEEQLGEVKGSLSEVDSDNEAVLAVTEVVNQLETASKIFDLANEIEADSVMNVDEAEERKEEDLEAGTEDDPAMALPSFNTQAAKRRSTKRLSRMSVAQQQQTAKGVKSLPPNVARMYKMMKASPSSLGNIAVDSNMLAAVEAMTRQEAARMLSGAGEDKAVEILQALPAASAGAIMLEVEFPFPMNTYLSKLPSASRAPILKNIVLLDLNKSMEIAKACPIDLRADVLTDLAPDDAVKVLLAMPEGQTETLSNMLPVAAAPVMLAFARPDLTRFLAGMSAAAAGFVIAKMPRPRGADTLITQTIDVQAEIAHAMVQNDGSALSEVVDNMETDTALLLLLQMRPIAAARVLVGVLRDRREAIFELMHQQKKSIEVMSAAVYPILSSKQHAGMEWRSKWKVEWAEQVIQGLWSAFLITQEAEAWVIKDIFLKEFKAKQEKFFTKANYCFMRLNDAKQLLGEQMERELDVEGLAGETRELLEGVKATLRSEDKIQSNPAVFTEQQWLPENCTDLFEKAADAMKEVIAQLATFYSGKTQDEITKKVVNDLAGMTDQLDSNKGAMAFEKERAVSADEHMKEKELRDINNMSDSELEEKREKMVNIVKELFSESEHVDADSLEEAAKAGAALRPSKDAQTELQGEVVSKSDIMVQMANVPGVAPLSPTKRVGIHTLGNVVSVATSPTQAFSSAKHFAAGTMTGGPGGAMKNKRGKRMTVMGAAESAKSSTSTGEGDTTTGDANDFLDRMFGDNGIWAQVESHEQLMEMVRYAMDFITTQHGGDALLTRVAYDPAEDPDDDGVDDQDTYDDNVFQIMYITMDLDGLEESKYLPRNKWYSNAHYSASNEDTVKRLEGSDTNSGLVVVPIKKQANEKLIWGCVAFFPNPHIHTLGSENAFQDAMGTVVAHMQRIAGGITRTVHMLEHHVADTMDNIHGQAQRWEHAVTSIKWGNVMMAATRDPELVAKTTEYDEIVKKIQNLLAVKRRAEQMLLKPMMKDAVTSLRRHRKPKRAVVATVTAVCLSLPNADIEKIHAEILRILTEDLTMPENENAMLFLWSHVQKKMSSSIIKQMQRCKPTKAATEEEQVRLKACARLMLDAEYEEARQNSQASALMHEWVNVMIHLRDLNDAEERVRGELEVIKNKPKSVIKAFNSIAAK